MAHHRLHEWEVRRFDAHDAIPVGEAERLVRVAAPAAARLTGAQRAFDFRRDALVAQNLVGVVAAGDVSCEILPKVDRDGPADYPGLRRQLIRMLAVAHDLPIADEGATALGTQNETLLEILIARFAALLADAARRGLPRGYIAQAEDLPALRGRLDVQRQFTRLAVSPQRLACRYDEFSADVPLNRVMKATIMRLRQLTRSAANTRALAELALVYADVTAVPRAALSWTALVPDRSNTRWRALVRLARLILGDRFQNSTHGSDDGFALLFDMNILFERYVAMLLAPLAPAAGLTLTAQGGKRACLHPVEGGNGLFETNPELQLHRDGRVELVIDTKWKRLAPPATTAKMDVAQADLYQMMAYSQLYRCDRLVLLYPHHTTLPPQLASSFRAGSASGTAHLTVATVDLASHAAARASLAALLAAPHPCAGVLTPMLAR